MNKLSTLEQQIARAQEAMSNWPDGKLGMMQLQGADTYRARTLDHEIVRREIREHPSQDRRKPDGDR